MLHCATLCSTSVIMLGYKDLNGTSKSILPNCDVPSQSKSNEDIQKEWSITSVGGRSDNLGVQGLIQSLLKEQVLLPYLEKSEISPDIGPEIGPGIGSKISPEIGPKIGPDIGPEFGLQIGQKMFKKSDQKSEIPAPTPLILSRQASKEFLYENKKLEKINKNNQSVDEILVSEKGSKKDVQNTGVLFLLCHGK